MNPALLAGMRFGESDCEALTAGLLGQPVNTVTSLAFVAAGGLILGADRLADRRRITYGLLVIATGIGSVIAHGPAPPWGEMVHDAPLVALLAFVAVDAASDLCGRSLHPVWWLAPTLAALAVGEAGEVPRLIAQTSIATVAVGASFLRMVVRPETRRTILTALALLGTGALVGTLSRTGMPLCDPGGVVQGHAVWHVLAALATWRLAPVIGRVGWPRPADPRRLRH